MGKINKKARKVQVGGGLGDALAAVGRGVKSVANTSGTGITKVLGPKKSSLGYGSRFVSKLVPNGVDELDQVKFITQTHYEPFKTWTPTKSGYAEEEIWESLWNEPCYIDTETKTFSFSKLGKLWCNWTDQNNIVLKGAAAVAPKNYDIDSAKLKDYLTPKYEVDGVLQPVTGYAGTATEQKATALVDSLTGASSEGEHNSDTHEILQKIQTYSDELRQLHKEATFSAHTWDEVVTEKDAGEDGTTAADAASGGSGGEEACDKRKFFFCLFAKFLLGPAGYLVLKMAPHFVKFWYATTNTLLRIFYSLHNTINPDPRGMELPYINNKGDTKYYKPNLGTLFLTYLGTVVPFHFFKFTWGQKFGKGEFGKIIVGLVMVSIALITIGGIGITMLILAFSFYCIKVMGMFSDNIHEKKKK